MLLFPAEWQGGELMITNRQIPAYQGLAMLRGRDILMLPPHRLLAPYISNYTITCPLGMDREQCVLPTASTTLVYTVTEAAITGGLRGVNTVSCRIGTYAAQFPLLVLVEFHPAGLFPFVRVAQNDLLDHSVPFEEIDRTLDCWLKEAIVRAESISELTGCLDHIFLSHLNTDYASDILSFAMTEVIREQGLVRGRELAGRVGYSERHLNRLFRLHIGTGIKTFSRIVRMKYALDLLGEDNSTAAEVIEHTGHYDPAHFIRDFRELYGVTPKQYRDKMSVFYNDPFKLNQYNGHCE